MTDTRTFRLDRERSVGQIVRDTLRLYKSYPWLFILLALPVVAAYDAALLTATGQGSLGRGAHGSFAVSTLFDLLDFSLVGPLISALHAHAVVQIGEGRKPKLSSVAARGLAVLPVVAATEIVANICIGLGFLALFVPGLLLALCWVVAAQVAAVEDEGWMPSLSRSRKLTSGNYWRIIKLVVLGGAVVLVVHLGAARIPLGGAASAPSVALGIGLDSITRSLLALALALLYFDLRHRATRPIVQPVEQPLPDTD
ncbi:MAG: hypothetical protein ACTHM1_10035 [Solirubrobacteraceae bacterium]